MTLVEEGTSAASGSLAAAAVITTPRQVYIHMIRPDDDEPCFSTLIIEPYLVIGRSHSHRRVITSSLALSFSIVLGK
jgi:hypothetical protein